MSATYGAPRTPRDYLESRVTTASPADLQQMLLDGAVRFARQAKAVWDDETKSVEVYQLLSRVLDILETLTAGVTASTDPIAEQLEEQYAFLYREFAVVHLDRDQAKFEKALELLEYERDTWRMGCERAKGSPAEPAPPAAPQPAASPPRTPIAPVELPPIEGGFSVQA